MRSFWGSGEANHGNAVDIINAKALYSINIRCCMIPMSKYKRRGLFSSPSGDGEGVTARSRSGEWAGCWGLEKAREKAHKFYRGLELERHTRLKPSRKNFLGNSSPCSSLRSEQAVVTPQIQKKEPTKKARLLACFFVGSSCWT